MVRKVTGRDQDELWSHDGVAYQIWQETVGERGEARRTSYVTTLTPVDQTEHLVLSKAGEWEEKLITEDEVRQRRLISLNQFNSAFAYNNKLGTMKCIVRKQAGGAY